MEGREESEAELGTHTPYCARVSKKWGKTFFLIWRDFGEYTGVGVVGGI